MEAVVIIYKVLSTLLYGFDLLLLAHAICSWVPEWRSSKVYYISCKIVDPILKPIRKFMWRFDWVRRLPIDISFLVLVLLTRFADRILAYIFLFLLY